MSVVFMTIEEVAGMLRLSRDTVYRLAANGELPGKKVGRAWRFPKQEIEARLAGEMCNKQDEFHHQLKRLEGTIRERTNELTRANEALRREASARAEAERYLQAILDSVADGIAVANEHGDLLFLNPAGEQIVGMGRVDTTPDQWTATYGLFLTDGVTPCPSEKLPLLRALAGERVDAFEMIIRNDARPEPVWIVVRAAPIIDKDGNRKGAVAVFHDTTERRRSEEARDMSEDRLRKLVDVLPQIVHAFEQGENFAAGDVHVSFSESS